MVRIISIFLITMLLSFSAAAYSAQVDDGVPFFLLQEQINNLQSQINNIELTPGPTGPQGPPGEACTSEVTYEIGDLGPAGGIVFYIYAGGLHGLEAAPADQSYGAAWGCYGTEIAGADGTGLGTGAQNTADILAGCSDTGIAAELADNYSLNGYDDWFLPSKDELNLLWQKKGVVGGFADNDYWSSTEYDSGGAWSQNFFFGNQVGVGKSATLRVRAVRAF
jgi:hypothetical protein